jgi:muramidase (phage lysozyme)
MATNAIGESVEQLRAKIGRYHAPLGEQNTKAALIEPLLRSLGWDVEDVDEVHREYKQRSMDNPVDYALMLDRKPVLFVEAKGMRENLEDRRWAGQILGYAVVAGVEWVMLTNGDEYRIYNSHAPVPVQDKLFRAAKLTDLSTRPEEMLDLVSRTCIANGVISTTWRAHLVDHQVRAALGTLFERGHPDPNLVRWIQKKAKDVTAGQVRDALERLEVSWRGASIPPLAVNERQVSPRRPHSTATRLASSSRAPARRSDGQVDGGSSDVLRDIMSTRPGPLEIEKTYKGRRLTARVEPDGRVTWNGQIFDSLSTAGGEARASIIGIPPGRRRPQTNGWTFWRFRDDRGQLQPIDVLRATGQ